MLQTQPELRFSAEDVLDHPWLAVIVIIYSIIENLFYYLAWLTMFFFLIDIRSY